MMGIDRRKFLKFAGLAAAGLAAPLPLKAAAGEIITDSSSCASCEGTCGLPIRPLYPPEKASRWAMVVNLKTCREHPDCKDCIRACHLIHNVPDYHDPKDEVKWIWKEHFSHAFSDIDHPYISEQVKHGSALLLCNHCDNPPCVRVCPTKATWKRKEDGIVMMDWHRCIGCRYCLAACPYGSRSFNYREPKKFFTENNIPLQPDFPARTRGVVEKCTFCEERLVRGQWPACVEACKFNALAFGDIGNPLDPLHKLLQENFTLRRKSELGTLPEIYYII